MRRLDVLFLLTQHQVFGEGYFETGEIFFAHPASIYYIYHIHSCSPSLVAHHDQLCGVGKVDLLSLKKNYRSPKVLVQSVVILFFSPVARKRFPGALSCPHSQSWAATKESTL